MKVSYIITLSVLILVFVFPVKANAAYNLNCDTVEAVINKYYPSLKEGVTINKKELDAITKTRGQMYSDAKVNFLKYELIDIPVNLARLRPPVLEGGKCALKFTMPKTNKFTYWGVEGIGKDMTDKKPLVVLGRKTSDAGALLIILENNLILKYYKAEYSQVIAL